MSLTRRLMLGRSLIGALGAALAGSAAANSVSGRLAAGAFMGGASQSRNAQGVPATGYSHPSHQPLTPAWWSRNRYVAQDHVLQQGWTLPLDADVTGLRSLSPMARQRIMRRRWVERDLANRTMWDRVRSVFDR